jgi:membrane protein involved in colicin uptake
MPDPTKEELAARAKATADADAAARAKAEADAKARTAQALASAPAPATPQFAAADAGTLAAITETLRSMQNRLLPAGAATATEGLDRTKPGGFFIVNGVKQNSAGRELNDDGSLKHPEQQRVNEFGQLV